MGTMPFEVIAGPGTWQSVSEAKREAYVPLGAPATKARAGPRKASVTMCCANDYLTDSMTVLGLLILCRYGKMTEIVSRKTETTEKPIANPFWDLFFSRFGALE